MAQRHFEKPTLHRFVAGVWRVMNEITKKTIAEGGVVFGEKDEMMPRLVDHFRGRKTYALGARTAQIQETKHVVPEHSRIGFFE